MTRLCEDDSRIEDLSHRQQALEFALKTTFRNGNAANVLSAARMIHSFITVNGGTCQTALDAAVALYRGTEPTPVMLIEAATDFAAFLSVPPPAPAVREVDLSQFPFLGRRDQLAEMR